MPYCKSWWFRNKKLKTGIVVSASHVALPYRPSSSARVQRLVERKKERCLRRAGTPSHIKSSLLSSDACGGLFGVAPIFLVL